MAESSHLGTQPQGRDNREQHGLWKPQILPPAAQLFQGPSQTVLPIREQVDKHLSLWGPFSRNTVFSSPCVSGSSSLLRKTRVMLG